MKERLIHIDNAKAMGMMLIIASHIIPSEPVVKNIVYITWCNVLNSFYVPLFFLLSGIFEPSEVNDIKLQKRIVRLLRYCGIFYVFGIIADGLINAHWTLFSFRTQTTIWFLIVLLWITVIVGVVKRFKYHEWLYLFLAAGGAILSYKHISLFYVGQACVCLPFYLFGYYAKNFLKDVTFNQMALVLAFFIWLILFLAFYRTQNISLNLIGQNIIAFYLEAMAGSIVVIELCKLFDIKCISYYGRNSIVPMMIQLPLIWGILRSVDMANLESYLIVIFIVCIICGASIPLFRNQRYDIFK